MKNIPNIARTVRIHWLHAPLLQGTIRYWLRTGDMSHEISQTNCVASREMRYLHDCNNFIKFKGSILESCSRIHLDGPISRLDKECFVNRSYT